MISKETPVWDARDWRQSARQDSSLRAGTMIEICGGAGSVVDIENEISETSGAKKPSIKLLFYRSAEGAAIPKSKDALKPASHSVWNEISTKAPIPTQEVPVRKLPRTLNLLL